MGMHYMPMLVKPCPKYDTAILYHSFSQVGKYPARRALHTHLFVFALSSIYTLRLATGTLMYYWAYSLA